MEIIAIHAILNAELALDQIIINVNLVIKDLFFMQDNVSLNVLMDSIKMETHVINAIQIVQIVMDIAEKIVILVHKINSSLMDHVLIVAQMDSLLTMLINAKNVIKIV